MEICAIETKHRPLDILRPGLGICTGANFALRFVVASKTADQKAFARCSEISMVHSREYSVGRVSHGRTAVLVIVAIALGPDAIERLERRSGRAVFQTAIGSAGSRRRS